MITSSWLLLENTSFRSFMCLCTTLTLCSLVCSVLNRCFLELPCLHGHPSLCSWDTDQTLQRLQALSSLCCWQRQWVLLTLHISRLALKPVAAPVFTFVPIMQLVWVIYWYGCIELSVFFTCEQMACEGVKRFGSVEAQFSINAFFPFNPTHCIFPPNKLILCYLNATAC